MLRENLHQLRCVLRCAENELTKYLDVLLPKSNMSWWKARKQWTRKKNAILLKRCGAFWRCESSARLMGWTSTSQYPFHNHWSSTRPLYVARSALKINTWTPNEPKKFREWTTYMTMGTTKQFCTSKTMKNGLEFLNDERTKLSEYASGDVKIT